MAGRDHHEELPVAQRLGLFLARVDELLDTRMVRQGGLNVGFSVNADRVKGTSFEFREPDEDDLRSFLLTFRQFVSGNESVFVNRVHTVCWQCISSDQLKAELSRAQHNWRTATRTGSIQYVENGISNSPEKVLDLWINGHYFHNDRRKVAELSRLTGFGALLTRQIFLSYLVEATRYILLLRNVIVVARKEGLLVT